MFHIFCSLYIADFEQANVCWDISFTLMSQWLNTHLLFRISPFWVLNNLNLMNEDLNLKHLF